MIRQILHGLLICLLLPLVSYSRQPVFILDSWRDSWSLNPQLFILELEGDDLTLGEVRSPERQSQFVSYPELQKKYPPSRFGGRVLLDPARVYWGRVLIQNQLTDPSVLQNWILFTGTSNFTEVYLVTPGKTDHKRTGTLVPASEKDFPFANDTSRVLFSLPHTDTAELYVRLKVTDGRPLWFDVRLAKRDFYENWNFVSKTRMDWIFIGFLLTLFFVHLLFYFASRDIAFLFHALFQAGIFFYLLEFFDIMSDVPWLRNHPQFVQTSLLAALCVVDVAYLQFIRVYMRLWKLLPRWDKIFRFLSWIRGLVLLAGIFVAHVLGNAKLAGDITAFYMISAYLFLMVFLWALYRTKEKKGYFLIAGTLFFILGVLLNAWSVIEGFGLQSVYTMLGIFGEVTLFTWGLGYRMKIIRQEETEMRRLKELDEFKSRFYTNITHEFRTPLTVILGMTEQLKPLVEKTGTTRTGEAVSMIHRNAGTLLQLINRILDLSKLEAGKMELHLRKGNIVDYLIYLTNAFQSFAATHDVQLRFLTDLEHFEMDYDPEKLQDVMSNLLSNAVKFTPAGGRISVLVKQVPAEAGRGEQLKIIVKDTGAGISPEALPHIFDRFFQAKEQGNMAGGTGVGLMLTRELVELMGGRIKVESEPGAGTDFTVLLPVSRLASPAVEDFHPETAWPTSEPASNAGQDVPAGDELDKPLCLVIEDSPDVVRYLQTLLEKDYLVAVAFNGARGIEKALELVPDIIISDVMMPEKDGLEVCDFLKNDERTSHIPIILLTAKATLEDRIEGLRRGADAYLQKPFNQEELFVQLKKLVELRRRIIRHFSAALKTPSPVTPDDPELEIEDAFIQKAREAVEANLSDEDFDVHRLCRALTLSRAQLHRKLTALTGMSATLFIRSVRLARAKELLSTTTLTVSEIAYEVGYKDPNYFTRTFTEEFGKSPSETRK